MRHRLKTKRRKRRRRTRNRRRKRKRNPKRPSEKKGMRRICWIKKKKKNPFIRTSADDDDGGKCRLKRKKNTKFLLCCSFLFWFALDVFLIFLNIILPVKYFFILLHTLIFICRYFPDFFFCLKGNGVGKHLNISPVPLKPPGLPFLKDQIPQNDNYIFLLFFLSRNDW